MEDDPSLALASQFQPQLRPIVEHPDESPPPNPWSSSISEPLLLFQDLTDPTSVVTDPQSSSTTATAEPPKKSHSVLHRCKTAPALAVVRDLNPKDGGGGAHDRPDTPQSESGSLVKQAFVLLVVYLSLGVAIYSFNTEHFSGVETHPVVDALYFCIVTMCTIGYGDIAPLTPSTKVFACVFVLVGFGFIDILLSGVVNYVLDLQENMILTATGVASHRLRHHHHHHGFSAMDYIVDVAKGRMRIRLKVGLALGVVVLCVGVGVMFLRFAEGLDWIDSVYLSIMSVTTVGYGDRAFKTLNGRIFAAVWLLLSTLAVARAFLYLAEARVDKRHRRVANWVLQREITVQDLLAADINNNGFIR